MKQIKTLEQLTDARILFEKPFPPFGCFFLLIIALFISGVLAWSIRSPKAYMITAYGCVTSSDANYVMSSYTGEIGECNMREGQLVEEGDILFKIKSIDYDVQQEQLKENRVVYEEQIAQYQLLVQSIKDDINYFDAAKSDDTLYYCVYEAYKSQVAQNQLDTDTYKIYGYTDEQIEAELEKNQGKIAEIYYSAIQSAENAICEAEMQIDAIDAQVLAIESGKAEYIVRATASGKLHLMGDYKTGMVVQAASAVAMITPENADTIIEAYVSTADMAKIHEGDCVQIAVDGLTESLYGNIAGKVVQIDSNLSIQENRDGSTDRVFRIKIKPEENYLISKYGEKVDIVNGMTTQARIEYDKVTYFDYFLEKVGYKQR